MTGLWLVLAALYGAAAGSYLGVVVDRLPRGRAMSEASSCGACGRPLRARDNVPLLSYVLLRGRCSRCAAGISRWWWLLEVVLAAFWVAAAAWLGAGLVLVAVLACAWLVVLFSAVCLSSARGAARAVRIRSWAAAAVPAFALALLTGALGAATHSSWGPAAELGGSGVVLLLLSVPLAPKTNPVVGTRPTRTSSGCSSAAGRR